MMKATLCVLILILAGCGSSESVSSDFLPEGVEIPSGFETSEFRVRPITAADAEKDYEAVMESIDIIHTSLLSERWPTESFTLEENRRDLANKEIRFRRRTSFTYTVVSLDESQVLGCVYINKGQRGPDAAVFMWVRSSAYELGLDPLLEAAVREWMDRDWPFEWVVYPGRNALEPEEM